MKGKLLQEIWDTFSAEENVQIKERVQELRQQYLTLIVARIQRMRPNPDNITPASGLLAQHLRELPDTPDPDFDVEEWMKEWDRFEAEMKAASLV